MGIFSIDLGLSSILDKVLAHLEKANREKENTHAYLTYLINVTEKLGTDWVDSQEFRLDIERAFVPVQFGRPGGRSYSLKSIFGQSRLVIQGNPGSGKSSLSRFVTWIMAQANANPRKYKHLPQDRLNCTPLFPLRVDLRKCIDSPVYKVLLAPTHDVPSEYIQQKLSAGKILICFDGLDEIGVPKHRYRIMEEIGEITNRYDVPGQGNRFLVTTRPVGYSHQTLAQAGYKLYTLEELTPEQQREMIYRYYELWAENFESRTWQEKASALIKQIQDSPTFQSLSGNPLLLSQLAKLHFDGERLPGKRHELYKRCIQGMITRREPDNPDMADTYLSILGDLALEMHKNQGALSPAQTRRILHRSLEKHLPIPEIAEEDLRDKIVNSWNLLLKVQDKNTEHKYRFLYPPFREYLAAYAISKHPDEYWPILREHLYDDWWREIMLLYAAIPQASGDMPLRRILEGLIDSPSTPNNRTWILAGQVLSHSSSGKIDDKIKRIADTTFARLQSLSRVSSPDSLAALTALCWSRRGRKIVIERIQEEIGQEFTPQSNVFTRLKDITDPIARHNLREAFLQEIKDCPRPEDRIVWAEALGQIGDTRLGQMIDVTHLVRSKGKDQRNIKIARYPVSNLEYARFVNDTGRALPSHWHQDGYPPHRANYPVTNVSYGDAQAYCRWRSQTSRGTYRLPTKEEWLSVATNNDGRSFPWGNERDQYRFNWRKNIGDTTPVGIYLEGESPQGVSDLLGNVWEWTDSHSKDLYILKGGAWDSMDLLREGVAASLQKHPNTRSNNIGFRVIVEE